MNRKRLAAALAYVDEKAKRLTSLDQPKESDVVDMALEMGGSFIPGVGQALAARDFERARRADDEAGMAMAAASALPVGRLVGALKGFDPVMREIDVYHGSPHRFEEFDASKIGTGEGQQAYGHGIYLAEQKDVADMYRRALTPHKVSDDDAQSLASYAMRQRHDSQSAIDWLNKQKAAYKTEQSPETLAQYDAAIKVLQGGNVEKVGNLYTADLPDEMVDRMLDWDKPLSEQPKVLRALLNADDEWKAYATQLSPKARKLAEDMAVGAKPSTGDEAYKLFKQLDADNPNADHNAIYDVIRKYNPRTTDQDWMMSMMSGSGAPGGGVRGGGGADLYNTLGGGAEAAQKLRAAGISGMRYLDAGSRDQGGGTRNFVVFPGEEKKVKILKRE